MNVTFTWKGMEFEAEGTGYPGEPGSWEEPGEDPYFEIESLAYMDGNDKPHDATWLLEGDFTDDIISAANAAAFELRDHHGDY